MNAPDNPDAWRCLGKLVLRVRPSVALRERQVDDGMALYLSLYDDEIDSRAEAFWAVPGAMPAKALWLELTDAAILACGDEVVVVRGAACTFPLYRHAHDGKLQLSTRLPLDDGTPLLRAGLTAACATAALHSSYEPNAFTETPLSGWHRLRRGALTRCVAGDVVTEQVIGTCATAEESVPDRKTIAARVRAAFEAYGRSQRHVHSSLLEVSGGFDSTLAAAALPSRAGMHGVSVAFPYYEFRFEGGVQAATADALGIPRIELDGTDLFPYSPSEQLAAFEEPSVFITAIRHAEHVACYARQLGAERIYMGHGGDQCFSTDLTRREELVRNPPSRGPFTRSAWRTVAGAIDAIRRSPWQHRSIGSFVYDARQDVWVKERFGLTIRTPFTDLAVFRAAQDWSRWCGAAGVRPDKTILADALPDWLPAAILRRRGKVAYDGVWLRAYAQHGDYIANVIERSAAMFEVLGLSARWLVQRIRALQAWQPVSDRELLAAYALAVWLQARGLERPSELFIV